MQIATYSSENREDQQRGLTSICLSGHDSHLHALVEIELVVGHDAGVCIGHGIGIDVVRLFAARIVLDGQHMVMAVELDDPTEALNKRSGSQFVQGNDGAYLTYAVIVGDDRSMQGCEFVCCDCLGADALVEVHRDTGLAPLEAARGAIVGFDIHHLNLGMDCGDRSRDGVNHLLSVGNRDSQEKTGCD